jgi:hypothetical protein
MAKRSRKGRPERAAKQVESAPPAQPAEIALSSAPSPSATDFTEEYHYVYTDVRSLLAVTAIMIILMVGLSFIV